MAKILYTNIPAYTPEWTIVAVAANPKRPGTDAFYDYEILEDGMTVGELATALKHKKIREEIKWNFNRGYVSLQDPDGKVYGKAAEDEEVTEETEA